MRRKIPVHLQTPDTLLLNMTARQTLVMALGITLTYITLSSAWSMPLLFIPAIVLALAILAIAFLVAFVAPKKRYLDTWVMVALSFLLSPKCYVWRPLPQERMRESKQNRTGDMGLD